MKDIIGTSVDDEEIDVPEEIMFDDESDVTENDDGTAEIDLGEDQPDESDFSENLALLLDEETLDELASKYLELIEKDKDAREKRDEKQEEGMTKAGLGSPASGGATFDGASRVTHPILSEAYVDFAASSIKELFPPNGPVRTQIMGEITHEKLDRAKRKVAYMNKQLTKEVVEYRPELEKLLTQLPNGGSQYMKVYWSQEYGRPTVDFVPIDKMILPYSTKSFYKTPRKFHEQNPTQWEYENNVINGTYRDIEVVMSSTLPEETKSEVQLGKIEGKVSNYYNDDGVRTVYEGCVYEKLEDDPYTEDIKKACPYILILDEVSQKILGLYRNWSEDDSLHRELEYIVEFTFIPWRGAYGIGLPHLIGDLSTAMTGALRALLDSAFISNSTALVKFKGRPGGESIDMSPAQVTEIDALGDDIRKLAMPLSFNGPSPVLLQLLGFLTDAAKGVVTTSEEKIADASNNMPVGTAIALIEQGAKIYSSIHARLHESQRKILEIIHRLNYEYVDDRIVFGEDENDYVEPKDFRGPIDVYPVSDPNIFSETQRMAQVQALMQLASAAPPGMYDIRKIHERIMEVMKIPNYKEVLPDPPASKPMNPAAESIAMAMGTPVAVFPDQDHVSHVKVHLGFAMNPVLGLSKAVAAVYIPAVIDHIQQHIMFYYAALMQMEGSNTLGTKIEDYLRKDKSWEADQNVSEILSRSSMVVNAAVVKEFGDTPKLMEKALQFLQSIQPPPAVDPMIQLGQQEIQMRTEKNKQDGEIALQRLTAQTDKQQADVMIKMKNLEQQMQKLMMQIEAQNSRTAEELNTEVVVQKMKSESDLEAQNIKAQTSLQIEGGKIGADIGRDVLNNLVQPKGEVQ